MIGNLISFFKKILGPNYKVQTFTYYIPSPPKRKFGYREKEFDNVFYQFINRGYEIIDLKAIPNNAPDHAGMWIIATVKATNRFAENLDLDFNINMSMPENIEYDE